MRKLRVFRALIAVVGFLVVLQAGVAHAECDANALCPSDGCTITGTHDLDDCCVLNFGTKNVTIGGGAVLRSAVANGGEFSIHAGNLTHRGLLKATGGTVSIDVSQLLRLDDGQIGANMEGEINITAGSAEIVGSSELRANGDNGAVDICTSFRDSQGECEFLVNSLGSIGFHAVVDAQGATKAPTVVGGDVVVVGGAISFDAGTAATGGFISLSGLGPMAIAGSLASGGDIYAETRGRNDISIVGQVTSNGGDITVGPACNISVAGSIAATGLDTVVALKVREGTISVDGNVSAGDENDIICRGLSGSCINLPSQTHFNPNYIVSVDSSIESCGPEDCSSSAPGDPCDFGPCYIDSFCTAAGFCTPGSPKCSDGNQCTRDICDPVSGACSFPAADGVVCFDPSVPCFDGVCNAGSCVALPICDDGDACTVDSCDAAIGVCRNVPLAASDCEDGNACTVDSCDPTLGGCQHVALTASDCDDGNQCTDDTCDPAVGCEHRLRAECLGPILSILLSSVCGDGLVEGSEQCDDGNTNAGDCCSPTCQAESSAVLCDDGNPCTSADACDGGACVGIAAPDSSCRTALRGSFQLRDRNPDKRDGLNWKWLKGRATDVADFGDPVGGATRYDICVYDEDAGASRVVMRTTVSPGGSCGGRPCWRAAANRLRYADRDGTAGGITKMDLTAGTDGKAKISIKGKGANVAPPPLPLVQDSQVTVQLSNTEGVCWSSVFLAPATRNESEQFKDKFKVNN